MKVPTLNTEMIAIKKENALQTCGMTKSCELCRHTYTHLEPCLGSWPPKREPLHTAFMSFDIV